MPRLAFKPRRRQVRLDDVSRLALVRDYESGASLGQVAQKYGVNTSTATRHVLNAGVAVRPKEIKILVGDLPVISQLRADGWALQAIGDLYGCSAVAVANRLKRYEASLSES